MHQGSYKHTTEDLEERTGLSRNFINKCSSKMSDLLDRYRHYGDNNQLFYNDSGLMVFDHISQLKREGKTIPQIKETLEAELQNRQDAAKSDRKTSQDDLQNRRTETSSQAAGDAAHVQLIEALQESNREVRKAKDEVIESQRETINSLQQNVRLLTDGRDPETVKKEHEQKIQEAAEQKQKIKELRKEKEQQEKRRRQRTRRRKELITEPESLEGK